MTRDEYNELKSDYTWEDQREKKLLASDDSEPQPPRDRAMEAAEKLEEEGCLPDLNAEHKQRALIERVAAVLRPYITGLTDEQREKVVRIQKLASKNPKWSDEQIDICELCDSLLGEVGGK